MISQTKISTDPAVINVDAFALALRHVIDSTRLTNDNHNLCSSIMLKLMSPADAARILHDIFKIHHVDTWKAIDSLEHYILHRLIPQGQNEWMQNTIVHLISMGSSTEALHEANAQSILKVVDLIYATWNRSLSSDAANVSHTLIWKQLENRITPNHTLTLCNLALHKILEQADNRNIGKLERKLILYHLSNSDYNAAHEVLQQTPKSRQSHPLARFLSYRLALKTGSQSESYSIINSVLSMPDTDTRLILAYVQETSAHGNNAESARLLQRLVDKYVDCSPKEVDLVVLTRSTIKVLISAIEEASMPQDEALARIRGIFKTVLRMSQLKDTSKQPLASVLCSIDRRWFHDVCFELATKYITSWPAKLIVDLFDYCIQLRLISEPSNDQLRAIQQQAQEANIIYLQAVLYTAEAQSCQPSWTLEDIPQTSYSSRARPKSHEIKHVLYQNAFDRYMQFQQHHKSLTRGPPDTQNYNLHTRLLTLLPFAFEALLFLNLHPLLCDDQSQIIDEISLNQLIDKASHIDAPPQIYAIIADIVLSFAVTSGIHSSIETRLPLLPATRLLARLISTMRISQTYNVNQAARWVRCIIQLILDYDQSLKPGVSQPDSERREISIDADPKLQLLTSMVEQVLLLARSSIRHTNPNSTTNTYHNTHSIMDQIDTDVPDQGYPPEELEYLATVLFNMAIDLYASDQEDTAKEWAGKAIEVADCLYLNKNNHNDRDDAVSASTAENPRNLAAILRTKVESLGWKM